MRKPICTAQSKSDSPSLISRMKGEHAPLPSPRGTPPRSQCTRRSHRDAEESAGLWQLSAGTDGRRAAHGTGEPSTTETKGIKQERRCQSNENERDGSEKSRAVRAPRVSEQLHKTGSWWGGRSTGSGTTKLASHRELIC